MQEKVRKSLIRLLVMELLLYIFIFALVGFVCIEGNRLAAPFRLAVFLISVAVCTLLLLVRRNVWYRAVRGMEDADKAADIRMREVIANITHDLKTPLASIRGCSQGILAGVAQTPGQTRKYVGTIARKANDMAGLVDELSFFVQIYQKDIEYNFQNVVAADYLSDCVSALSLDLETRNISLVYRCEAGRDVQICIDTERMKRVIYNIIGNASKYIHTDIGVVFVRIRQTQAELIVQISDNGVGIAEEELKHIFERFYRTDSSRNSKTGGSGLGLSIAKKIVEDHNGRIWAESEPGGGTKISFSLPKFVDENGKM